MIIIQSSEGGGSAAKDNATVKDNPNDLPDTAAKEVKEVKEAATTAASVDSSSDPDLSRGSSIRFLATSTGKVQNRMKTVFSSSHNVLRHFARKNEHKMSRFS